MTKTHLEEDDVDLRVLHPIDQDWDQPEMWGKQTHAIYTSDHYRTHQCNLGRTKINGFHQQSRESKHHAGLPVGGDDLLNQVSRESLLTDGLLGQGEPELAGLQSHVLVGVLGALQHVLVEGRARGKSKYQKWEGWDLESEHEMLFL